MKTRHTLITIFSCAVIANTAQAQAQSTDFYTKPELTTETNSRLLQDNPKYGFKKTPEKWVSKDQNIKKPSLGDTIRKTASDRIHLSLDQNFDIVLSDKATLSFHVRSTPIDDYLRFGTDSDVLRRSKDYTTSITWKFK